MIRLLAFLTPKKIIMSMVLILASYAHADAATINASSCSLSNVQSALNSAASGDTIIVPGGACKWDSALSISKQVTLKGTGKELTVITGGSTGQVVIKLNRSGARITGFGFVNGSITVDGDNSRIDNNKFSYSKWYSTNGIQVFGTRESKHPTVLIDNNEFVNARILVNGCQTCFAHQMWTQPLALGTFNAAYIEDNTFTITDSAALNVLDGNYGMRAVFRYNNVSGEYVEMHSMQQNRGTRSWEVYGNTLEGRVGFTDWRMPIRPRGGSGVIFDNILTGSWSGKVIYADNRRTYDSQVEGGLCDGNNSQGYDQNTPGGAGYLCRDQIGSSYDAVQWAPGSANTQTKSPAYEWNNVYNPGATNVTWQVASGSGDYHIKLNRDIYADTASFSGATGMGRGTIADRPSTCTTGVAYWATDADFNWNMTNGVSKDGALYKCTSTNTWSLFYIPYIYPHPLQGSVITPDTTPAVVTNNTPANIQCDAASPLDSMVLSVATNELADCAYCEDSATDCDATSGYDKILAAGAAYTTTGGTTHNQTLTNRTCSTTWTYRSACKDRSVSQNKNTTSTASVFTISAPGGGDVTPPVRSNYLPNGAVFPCITNPTPVALSVHAEDQSTPIGCKYNQTTDAVYASMAGTFDTTGGTPTVTVDDSYPESNHDITSSLYSGYETAVGQSFESNGGTLHSISFYLFKVGSPTGTAYAKVYAHSGTFGTSSVPTGAVLATSDGLDVSTLGVNSGAIALKTLAVSGANRISLVDGTRYTVVLEYTGGNSTNKVAIARDSTAPSHPGNSFGYSSGTWNVQATRDAIFYVNTQTSASTNDFAKTVNLGCGANYNFYYRCADSMGNANTDSVVASFTVAPATPTGQIEFEACTLSAPMAAVADVTASGGSYVSSPTAFSGTATCTVNVAEAGTYRIIARTMAADTGTDSAFLTVGANPQITWLLNPGPDANAWNIWRLAAVNALGVGTIAAPQYDPYQVALAAGDNTLVFDAREAGAKLDYFYVEKVTQPPGNTTGMVGSGNQMLIGTGAKNTMVIH